MTKILPFREATDSPRDAAESPNSDPSDAKQSATESCVAESSDSAAPTSDRFATSRNDAFDWVRAIAAIAVVVLHACVPYLVRPMPGLVWPVRDASSQIVDALFWSIELVIMPTFLIMAGFFAWNTLARRGASDLLRSRSKRLLRPLLFGALVILPLDLYIWVYGFVCEGWVQAVKLKSLKFDEYIDRDLWGFSHLWFLHYLWSYVALLALGSWCARKTTGGLVAKIRNAWSLPSTLACVMLVGAIVLWFRPEVIWGFQHRVWPVPSKWIYNGLFFIVGASIANFDPQTIQWRSVSRRSIALAGCAIVAAVVMGQWWLDQTSSGTVWPRIYESGPMADASSTARVPVAPFPSSLDELSRATSAEGSSLERASIAPTARIALALVTTTGSLFGSLMLISVALRLHHRFHHPRAVATPTFVKYLAAASFWIYLLHHPLLGLIHIDFRWAGGAISPLAKMAISATIATAISLASYEVLVRRSRFGRWLGFDWAIPSEQPQTISISTPVSSTIDSDDDVSIPDSDRSPTRRAA